MSYLGRRVSSFVRVGLLCILPLFLCNQQSLAVGVTIITHGYQATVGHPSWLDAMGNAIAARSGNSTLVYSLDIASATPLKYEYGSNLTVSTNAEIVIKLYWDKWADQCNPPYATTANIAATVVPFLFTNNLTPTNGGPTISRPLVEMPLHLIGHSRGGSVVLEIAHLLAQGGVWVDHVTTLDPHPITSSDLDALCLLHLGISPDPVVQLYDNVVFADEYYQFDSDGLLGISGVPVAGATQQFLNNRFDSDGLPAGLANDHQAVHDWYHGTIDTGATTVAGDPIPRAAWYVPTDIGFQFSLIAKGQALRDQIQSNYTSNGLKWKGATRTTVNRIGQLWPNIELENINSVWAAQAGTQIPILIRFQNSYSNNVVTVGLGSDTDQNPYNNAATNIVANYSLTNIDSRSWYFSTNIWTFASGDTRKYAYAKITDYKGFVRYYYLSQPFQVLPPPNNPLLLSPQLMPDGKFTAVLSGETGRTYVIEVSTNFANWTQIKTNMLTNRTAPFIDPSAPGLARRFYRAVTQ